MNDKSAKLARGLHVTLCCLGSLSTGFCGSIQVIAIHRALSFRVTGMTGRGTGPRSQAGRYHGLHLLWTGDGCARPVTDRVWDRLLKDVAGSLESSFHDICISSGRQETNGRLGTNNGLPDSSNLAGVILHGFNMVPQLGDDRTDIWICGHLQGIRKD